MIAMTLGTARIINKISKVFLMLALVGIIFFFVAYSRGGVEFKYVSLPVMACFIGITWFATSKAAVMLIEEENKKEAENK